MLEREFVYFKEHRAEYLADHTNEFVVIVVDKVLGFYRSEAEALKSVADRPLGTFFIKKCVPEDQDVVEYHSRVAFV